MTSPELLAMYRRILNSIHELGNIYYDRGRFEAYKLIAVLASDERRSPSLPSLDEQYGAGKLPTASIFRDGATHP